MKPYNEYTYYVFQYKKIAHMKKNENLILWE